MPRTRCGHYQCGREYNHPGEHLPWSKLDAEQRAAAQQGQGETLQCCTWDGDPEERTIRHITVCAVCSARWPEIAKDPAGAVFIRNLRNGGAL